MRALGRVLIALACGMPGASGQTLVPVGAAVVDVTPAYPTRLAGYRERLHEAVDVAAPIHARALVIGTVGPDAPTATTPAIVLLTVDSCGVPRSMTEAVFARVAERHGVPRERFAICATHTHSAPWLRDFAPNMFTAIPAEHTAHLERYERELADKLVEVVDAAIAAQRPGMLTLGYGAVNFAINRRVIADGRWTRLGEAPEGPTDQRVPVLAAHDTDGRLIAVLANHACHCTSESPECGRISGDWAGAAADIMEAAHPGAVALVAIGCGADANPSPRGTYEHSLQHGRTFAAEVERLLALASAPEAGAAPAMRRIDPRIRCRLVPVDLPLADAPPRAEWERQAQEANLAGARARHFLQRLDAGDSVPTTVPGYPVQTWCFGDDLAMVFLAGEVVVDYALRMQRMFDRDRLWINAYANDVPCYIASARLLREGGYECDGSMVYYRQPARLAPAVEDLICDAVQQQLPHAFYSPALLEDFPGPRDPPAALRSMTTKPGLEVVLAAAEPLVRDPIAFDWDERGRLWVVEMGDYPTGDGPHAGRVRLLTDADADGVYDHATTFLDDLAFPCGIHCWRGGAIVAMAPEIFYAEDTDGDGAADVRRSLYRGFTAGNQQHRVNGLRWGLDGWLALANGDSGGDVAGTGAVPGRAGLVPSAAPVSLRGRDLRIHPDTNAVDPMAGVSQFGRERDAYGRWFGTNNSNPIWQYLLEDRYVRRNPHAGIADTKGQVAETPGAAAVFPTSRTLSRFNDFSLANRFTSACGTGIYSDVLLGDTCAGNAFTCEPVHNLVSRLVLDDDRGAAVAVRGRRAADEGQSEFLASSDNWFRPTMVRTGPDGALWIADMYRAVIEHPEWIPDEYRRKLDLHAGTDRGRIYRVAPVGSGQAAAGGLRAWFKAGWDHLPLVEVAERLESPNGWWRDWAQRVLMHRQAELAADRRALDRLESVARRAATPQRIQALATLAAVQPTAVAGIHPAVRTALAAREPQVRRIAVELLEPAIRAGSPEVIPLLETLAEDPAECVRLQLLLSLGEAEGVEGGGLLGRLLARHGDSTLLRDAGLTSLTPTTIGPVMQHVLAAERRDHTDPLIGRLMAQAAAMGRQDLLVAPLAAMLRSVRNDATSATLAHVGATLRDVLRGPAATALRGHADVGPELAAVTQACVVLARTPDAAPDRRAAALAVLAAVGPAGPDLAELAAVVAPQTPLDVQVAAVRLLAGHGSPAVVRSLLERLDTCAPTVRSELLGGLIQREASIRLLLDAVAAGDLAAAALDAEQRDRLANHRDPAIAAAARDLLSRGQASDRRAIVEDYRGRLAGLTADPGAGRAVFERRCGVCHRLEGLGREVGADLAALKDRSTDALLTAILDPNRAVESKYLTCTVVTTDGQALSGMLKGESGSGLTLVAGDGKEATISRSDIEEFVVSSRSLMPEGLEKDLTPQDLADVIAFVQTAGVPWKRFAGNAPAPVAAASDGTITLPAAAAEIYGASLVFEKKYANLGFWNSPDDSARWSFDVPRTGRWTVELDFACDDATAGGLIRFSTGTRMLTGRVPGTGDWGTYRTWKVGAIDLRSGRGELIVTAAEHAGPALVDLRAIRLIPQ